MCDFFGLLNYRLYDIFVIIPHRKRRPGDIASVDQRCFDQPSNRQRPFFVRILVRGIGASQREDGLWIIFDGSRDGGMITRHYCDGGCQENALFHVLDPMTFAISVSASAIFARALRYSANLLRLNFPTA